MPSRATYNVIDRANDDNPCRYCTPELGRDEDCHARCEQYLAFHKKKSEAYAEKKQDFQTRSDIFIYKRDILPEYRRKNRR